MWLVLIGMLAIPALFAAFARSFSGAIAAAMLPGFLFVYSLVRLCEMSHEGCGLGAGIVMFMAIATGVSAGAALGVGLLRYFIVFTLSRRRSGLEFYTEQPVGLNRSVAGKREI